MSFVPSHPRAILPGMTCLRALGLVLAFTIAPAAADPAKPAKIPVAFVISDGAVLIDFTGPWAVFEEVRNTPFELYTVAETAAPIRASTGMRIVPDYTFANAPRPKIIVIPAQGNHDKAVLDWVRSASSAADLTMSVCNGAFLLAKTGLLDGKSATTFHISLDELAHAFPKVKLERGARFVDSGKVATAGGLSSGIDLALHVVERYFGRNVAEQTAYDLEYQGKGWTDPKSNAIYLKPEPGVEDPVCHMHVDPATSSSSVYRGQHYYFCSPDEKVLFDAHPERYLGNK